MSNNPFGDGALLSSYRLNDLITKVRLASAAGAMIFAIGIIPGSVLADGIQNASSASVSTAGQTAAAENASTVYYNAAGMTLLDRPQILIATTAAATSRKFADAGTTGALGGAIRGSAGDRDQYSAVPSLFATMMLTDQIGAGLGIFSPVDQANSYTSDWVGRYQVQSISLKTIDIDPAIAYRLTDALSVGAGIDIQYGRLARRSALDFGSICAITIAPVACAGLGLTPQSADGSVSAKASDWGTGFNLSALYQLGDSTRFGVNYRSTVRHDFSGDAQFGVPAAALPLTAGGAFKNTGLHVPVTFPELIAFGLEHKINDQLTLLTDIDWTGGSVVKQLTFDFSNPLQQDEGLALNWKDSIRFAVGGVYHIDDESDLRSGISWSETPTSRTFRTADIPDSDEIMASGGIMHRFTERFSATVSYSYGHFTPAPIDLSMPGAGTLVGTFRRSANLLALETQLKF